MDWHGVLDRGHFSAVVKEAYLEYKRDKRWLSFLRFVRHAYKYDNLFKKYNRGLIEPEMFWGNVYKDLGVRAGLIFENLVKSYVPLEEGWDLLRDVKSREVPLYILSDCPIDKRDLIMDLGVVDVFEKMFFSCDYGLMKNENAFFEIFTKEVGLKNGEFLFLDDNPVNVRKARQNGWQAMVFNVKNLSKIRVELGL
jgi:FMN phosphatase YigB (HAD superfamily)